MHLHPIRSSLLVLAFIGAVAAAPTMATFDRRQLLEQGEDYVVALHDNYLEAANQLKGARHPEIPRYFKERAASIEAGEDCFPAHPTEWPIKDAKMKARLDWAYQETFDIVTSEAGDVEPDLTAHVQIAYEQWLITMHIDPKDQDAEQLAAAFDKRLDALTESPRVSQLSPPTVPGIVSASAQMAMRSALPRRAIHRV